VIELRHISKKFSRNTANPVTALDDVTLTIPVKSFVVVIGANGSGKSTLLNALAGTVRVDSGQIIINGHDVTRQKDYQRSKWIARIFQNPLTGTSPDLTVLENFRLASQRQHSKKFKIGTDVKFRQSVREKIYLLGLGLENNLDQLMGTLSGGQRQALTLLMAVMPWRIGDYSDVDEAKLLLMDEPTAALDPKTTDLVLKTADRIIREFNLTVLYVTHQLKDALHYGDRIIRMSEGKIVQDLSNEAKAKLSISEVYEWFE
jgi:putative ABC transport system ATP-binding protein